MAKYKIILNPKSGSGTGAKAYSRIVQIANRINLDYDLVRTEQRGHGIEIAREAIGAGFDVIVAAGGDGTVNEVINGILQAEEAGLGKAALGILCVGRGNDFAGSVGIPEDLEGAFQALVDGEHKVVDVGLVSGGLFPDGRYFGNCVGIGFDAVTTIEVSKLPRLGGFLSFLIAVLKTIFLYYKGPVVRVDYDDQSLTQGTLLVSVMNGKRLGGGFWMAPNGDPTDGVFDLCIADQVNIPRILTLLPHFTKGTQATQKEIKMERAKHVTITALEGVLPAQTDGEIICVDGTHLDIELLPLRLSVVTHSYKST
jgi:YegS/Rv2252/BmrU family lipid kinase